jgi:hypothetical protein
VGLLVLLLLLVKVAVQSLLTVGGQAVGMVAGAGQCCLGCRSHLRLQHQTLQHDGRSSSNNGSNACCLV